MPIKYNLPPYIQLLGREQSPLGYQREYALDGERGVHYGGYTEEGAGYGRFAEAQAEKRNERTTSNIVKNVWKNTLGNLFGKDKDEDKKANRRRDRKRNPIFDTFIDIASKSAVKYVKSMLLKDDTESDKSEKEKEEKEDTKIQNDAEEKDEAI